MADPSASPAFFKRRFCAVWQSQLYALTVKSLHMVRFRLCSTLAVILAPCVAIALLYALSNALVVSTAPPAPLGRLARCTSFDVYSFPYAPAAPCVTVIFAPNTDAAFTQVMQRVATSTGLAYGSDVVGYASAAAAAGAMFDNAGRQFDMGVIFSSNANRTAEGEAEYEIWYNWTLPGAYARNGLDDVWKRVGVSGRHAALQLAVDSAIVAQVAGAPMGAAAPIDATIASFPDFESSSVLGGASASTVVVQIIGATFVTSGVVAGVLFAMMTVTSEKSRRLVGQLRTIGLYESAFWGSWLVAYVPVVLAMALLAPLIGQSTLLDVFVYVDYSVHFASLLLLGCATLANALCCASCVRSTWRIVVASFCQLAIAITITLVFSLLGLYPIVYNPAFPTALPGTVGLFPAFHYGKLYNTMNIHIHNTGPGASSSASAAAAATAGLLAQAGIDAGAADALRSALLSAVSGGAPSPVFSFSAPTVLNNSAFRGAFSFAPSVSPSSAAVGPGMLGLSGGSSGLQQYTWNDLNNVPESYTVYVDGLPVQFTDFSGAFSLWMLVAQTVGYLLLAWYFGQVCTGDMGAAEPFYFPCSPYYWGAAQLPATVEPGDTVARVQAMSAREGSVRLHKLSKMYKQNTAVKEVSLMLPPGQLVSLLGQNGAGKTTLVNVMSGLVSPTHGEAFLFGKSVRNEMAVLRDVIGIW